MTREEAAAGSSSDLLVRLRDGTVGSHARLEEALGLLRLPLARERFALLLERFHGFHAVWEPAIAPWFEPTFLGPRCRTGLLEADLAVLGRPVASARPPPCAAAAALGQSAERALGSLYVMEGSTLGGQVISHGLAGTGWADDLRYFNPYGRGTGGMWAALKAMMLRRSDALADPKIVAGAVATFDLLQDWLRPAFREAA